MVDTLSRYFCIVRELKVRATILCSSYTEQVQSKRQTHTTNIYFNIVVIGMVVTKLLLSYQVYGEQHMEEPGTNVYWYFTKKF